MSVTNKSCCARLGKEHAAEDVVRRREAIMATLLTGWLSDMEGAAAKRNVEHARKTADAIMEAAR